MVAQHSIRRHLTQQIPIYGVVLGKLQRAGLYTRPTDVKIGQWEGRDGRKWSSTEPVLWDVISQWTMSTQHAIARFLVPHLAKHGWAIVSDGDVLCREGGNIARLFDSFDNSKAVYCVQHRHEPAETVKMDGQVQSQYVRKNWSSFVAFNCDHPSNKNLTPGVVNTLPGRDLHRFAWLIDEEIGELGPEWNFLVRHSDPSINPKIVHFTDGVPDMPGYENDPYAAEWRLELDTAALGSLSLPG